MKNSSNTLLDIMKKIKETDLSKSVALEFYEKTFVHNNGDILFEEPISVESIMQIDEEYLINEYLMHKDTPNVLNGIIARVSKLSTYLEEEVFI